MVQTFRITATRTLPRLQFAQWPFLISTSRLIKFLIFLLPPSTLLNSSSESSSRILTESNQASSLLQPTTVWENLVDLLRLAYQLKLTFTFRIPLAVVPLHLRKVECLGMLWLASIGRLHMDNLAHGEASHASSGILWLGCLWHDRPTAADSSPSGVIPRWPPMLMGRLGSTGTHGGYLCTLLR